MKSICIKVNSIIRLYWGIMQLVRIYRNNKYKPDSTYVKETLGKRFEIMKY